MKPIERKAHSKLTEIAKEQAEKRKCQEYYEMSEGMRKLLCDECNKYGVLRTPFGYGVCKRYR